jgi:hypothetical protein
MYHTSRNPSVRPYGYGGDRETSLPTAAPALTIRTMVDARNADRWTADLVQTFCTVLPAGRPVRRGLQQGDELFLVGEVREVWLGLEPCC